MNAIEIDFDACSGCRTCYEACFVDVYRWDAEQDKPVVAYPEDCVECNYCEISCPTGALSVVPDYSKPFFRLLQLGSGKGA